jgi:acylphosphatase
MPERLVVLVSGQVQGVGFRYWVRQQAEPLGLTGSVTNRDDGRVEVVAEGSRGDLESLLSVLQSGAAPGHVNDVMPFWSAATGEAAGFRVR